MQYIALHYIALPSGQMVTPGEIFEAEFDEETLRRLTSRQALRPCQSLNITPPAPAEEEDGIAPSAPAQAGKTAKKTGTRRKTK